MPSFRLPVRTAAVAFVALLAAACAHERAANSAYAWAYLNEPGEGPKLAYGRPSSDEVLLMLACPTAGGPVEVSASGIAGGAIALASRDQTSRLAAKTADDGGTGPFLLARTSPRDPALGNFRRTGDLAILNAGKRHSISASSDERVRVKAFFEACDT
ncbi:hypothetical protein DMC25_17650 [Caulobacter sp. D4A]|uniref:hypothetical protein n=1 Tax=Caulobacter sp. D5 TaxID=357400 RepID=UPI000D725818|nr:hypothetical protein [Caulobacter sp. D5]PXA83800.1 hypothetical protein DMC25_17650 [Caulobacter sp. D4A]PXA92469.1 hypothetical protein DMC18_11040 [Caulobacter sp. D5]